MSLPTSSNPEKDQVTIPKIFFQTWKTAEVPDHWKSSPESVRTQMSSWKYLLLTDEDNRRIVAENFPDFLPYYDAFPYPIQRADAIRYVFGYLYGGIYMDLDLVITQPLDRFFTSDVDLYVVGSGNIGGFITNSFFACRPKAPILLEMIEHMKKPPPFWAIGKHFTVMATTGPIGFNSVIKKSNTPFITLPSRQFMPCSVCDLNGNSSCDLSQSVVTPLQGGSWNGPDSLFLNELMCNWDSVIVIIIMFLLLYLII